LQKNDKILEFCQAPYLNRFIKLRPKLDIGSGAEIAILAQDQRFVPQQDWSDDTRWRCRCGWTYQLAVFGSEVQFLLALRDLEGGMFGELALTRL